jgi:hypothetical protein
LYCILLTIDYIFFEKKTVMKFIILVSKLKEISPSVFSWKKPVMKFIILVSKLKEISPRVFSWKKNSHEVHYFSLQVKRDVT